MFMITSCEEEPDKYLVEWLDNIKYTRMKVGEQTDLLSVVHFAEWVELISVQIEMDGESFEIDNPSAFTPEYPGTCNIIFTIKTNKGKTKDIIAKDQTIAPLTYQALQLGKIKPVEILPIIWQVETWDKNIYKHIEHLRLAEATIIREMMWTYGAGHFSAEQYQELMARLNIWMMLENPQWYDNYESIWWEIAWEPSNHAHMERNILSTLINHANYKVLNPRGDRIIPFENYVEQSWNSINIFGCSVGASVNKKTYLDRRIDQLKEIYKSSNFILFMAWTNITETRDWITINKICHEDIEADEHWRYGLPSSANGNNDVFVDKHLLLTISTNASWDIDQTNEIFESSRFPVWFHNEILFAWREFCKHNWINWKIEAPERKYATSHANYVNVAIASLCFQMYAEVEDVDQLLFMIRSSTNLRDHIRFDLNWDGDTDDICDGQPETQELILMNPAGFVKKYLMPADSVINAQWWEFYELDKAYYKGIVFDIPGAEVNIGGEWIAYNDDNRSAIISQNPFTLKWRLNGNTLRKHGYRSGDTITGNIIVVDDQWNGLNIANDIIIKME